MRILVLEYEPSSQRGGQELSLLDVCTGLAGRGHQIDLVYAKPGDLLGDYSKFCSQTISVKCYAVDRTQMVWSLASWLISLLRVIVKTKNIDLIYSNQYHDSLFAGVLGAVLRKPVVCHLRLAPPIPICGQFRVGLSHISHFIAISKATKRDWCAAGFSPADIDVVYNGIDLERFKPGKSREKLRSELGVAKDTFVVLYLGRLDPRKGADLLLQGFARFAKELSNTRLLVVGGPLVHISSFAASSFLQELRASAQALGISDSVCWLGRRSDVPALCDASDVLVMPSCLPEAFGRSLIEAMACGIPAIGAHVGGIPEVLSDEFEQYIFSERDPAEIAQLLHRLADWRQTDPGLAIRCRNHVARKFDVRRTVAEIEACLQRVLALGRCRVSEAR